MEPTFAFDPTTEERSQPGVLLVLEHAPSSEQRARIEAALPRALVGLFSFEWPVPRRALVVADDVFLWDDFGGGKYAKAVRALATAVHRVVPVAIVGSDAQRNEGEEALRAAAASVTARAKPEAPRRGPRVARAKTVDEATERTTDVAPPTLDPRAVPAWREAMSRLEAAPEADVVRAAHACPGLEAKGKSLSTLTKDAILSVLRSPATAKIPRAQLDAALGAPLMMVAEIDLPLAERLGLAQIDAAGGVIAPFVRSATRALARSTRDDVLARLVECAARDPFCWDGLACSRHPRAADAALSEAESLLDRLAPRGVESGADRAPPGEEALTHPASTLIRSACERDRDASRARFLAWRARGGVRGLAAVKGLLTLLDPAELAAAGLNPFALAMRRVNDPALEAYAKWVT